MIRTTWPSMIFLLCCPCKATAMQVLHFAGNVWIPPPPSWIPYRERVVTLSFTITIIIIIKFWSFNFGRHVIFLNITGVPYPLQLSGPAGLFVRWVSILCWNANIVHPFILSGSKVLFGMFVCIYPPPTAWPSVRSVMYMKPGVLDSFAVWHDITFSLFSRDYSHMHLHVHVPTNVQGRHVCGYCTL